jgi:arylformamidase
MLEKAQILDLTKPMNKRMEIYREGSYSDPAFDVTTWCRVESQGFWVSQLRLGTQTGTHIDAPSHFKSGAESLEALPPQALIGAYFFVDLDRLKKGETLASLLDDFADQGILFLACTSVGASLEWSQFLDLCDLGIRVWVITHPIRIVGKDPLLMHRTLASRGVYLIEDLDLQTASRVRPDGELVALPLRLEGVSGSPCRVLVLHWP